MLFEIFENNQVIDRAFEVLHTKYPQCESYSEILENFLTACSLGEIELVCFLFGTKSC